MPFSHCGFHRLTHQLTGGLRAAGQWRPLLSQLAQLCLPPGQATGTGVGTSAVLGAASGHKTSRVRDLPCQALPAWPQAEVKRPGVFPSGHFPLLPLSHPSGKGWLLPSSPHVGRQPLLIFTTRSSAHLPLEPLSKFLSQAQPSPGAMALPGRMMDEGKSE